MPRPKVRSDEDVLDAALALVRAGGVERLTFAALAARCGLSAATLVQRFGSKAALVQRALLQAWDRLDAATADLARTVPKTPDGAVELLLGLSAQYGEGDVHVYRSGLLVLHEDLRDSALRARGAAWEEGLICALDACFAHTPGAPRRIGRVLAAHWQGELTWWAFRPTRPLADHLADSLRDVIGLLVSAPRHRR